MSVKKPVIKFTDFDYPSLSELSPDVFSFWKEFLDAGKSEWEVEFIGKHWKMGSLWEWEEREIVRKYANYPIGVRDRLSKVDVLVHSILEVRDISSGVSYSFEKEEDKVLLKHILLSADPYIVDLLYQVYLIGQTRNRERLARKYPEISKILANDFFVSFGSSSEEEESEKKKE